MSNVVVYEAEDEVLITSEADEEEFKKEFFDNDSGRKLDDYNREVGKYSRITLSSNVRMYGK